MNTNEHIFTPLSDLDLPSAFFRDIVDSSEIRDLCSMKYSNKMLQNLLCLIYVETRHLGPLHVKVNKKK